MRNITTSWLIAVALALATLSISQPACAVDGTWNVPTVGNWDDAGSWVGGTIADGAGSTANFTQPDLSASGTQVTLVSPRTIGNLVFADANPGTGTGFNWELLGSALMLAGGTPTITVNAMNPGGSAIINAPLAGTSGLIKAGVGQLTLGAATHTITGGVNVNGGTLRFEDAAVVPAQAMTIRNASTLSVQAGIGTATTGVINVPAANTATIVSRNGGSIAALGGGAGSTLNVSSPLDGATITAAGAWNAGGSLGTLNIAGVAGGAVDYFRIHSNGGAYVANSLLNTAVSLSDVVMFTRTGSNGNTIDIGALSGTASAVLSGGGGGSAGGTGTGSFATYSIGALNTNTTFAGTIDVASAMPDTGTLLGGINLTKVGTGTLTLSGTLNYQPTANGTANRRGGITTVSAGALKLTNNAAIPGGTSVEFPSIVRVLSGATLDVSGTSTPYSTAANQRVIGAGSIAGNYSHDEGTLAPGDTITGTTPTLIATAGTLTFNNNLSFAGSGDISFNLSPSTTSGNDKIQVNGTTNLTGTPTINIGLLGGITTGTYTLLESSSGLTGSAAGWVVNWPGRGSAPAVATSGNLVQMTIGAGNLGNVTWTGADPGFDSSWVAGPTGPVNWRNNNTGAADRFFDLDAVTFADAYGPGNTPVVNSTVALSSTVSPISMTFTSSTVAYSITGAGKISGGASLTKSGAATLVLQTANDFVGPASISGAGGVDIGAFPTALGAGLLTLSNTKLVVGAGTLSNTGIQLPAGTASEIAANGGGSLVLPSLSGDGNLLITTDTASRNIDLATNNSTYTGDVTLGAPGSLNNVIVRLSGTGSSLTNSKVTLNNASLRDRATSAQTVSLGALEGDATSSLWGYQGGSTSTARTWQIGALNLSTKFDGVIQDSINAQPTHLIKVGSGALTLTGANIYTGNTTVQGGTLSITNAYLADAADVFLSTGGILNLNTSAATDVIDQLYINGISQPIGVYGAIGSGAPLTSSLLSGSGFLQVQTYRLPGDFDNNNFVDGADLVVWRAAYGVNATGDTDGDGDSDGNDFLIWQRFLGRSNLLAAPANAVPEPGVLSLAVVAFLAVAGVRRRRSAR